MSNDLPIYDSWLDSVNIPSGWQPAVGPGFLRKVAIKNRQLLFKLKAAIPGKWMKVYRLGKDGSEVHYFEHASGKAFNVKHKPRQT